MCQVTPTMTEHPTALNLRRSALLGTKERMQSFRLPKESTSTLLHFHCDDEEPENDHQEAPPTEQRPSLNLRKMGLRQLPKQRMTSFRLPKDQTHTLLNTDVLGHCVEQAEPASISKPEPQEDNASNKLRRLRGLQNHKAVPRMNSFRLPKETTKPLLRMHADEVQGEPVSVEKRRRLRALKQRSKNIPRMSSFRLPKESTKNLLTHHEEPEEEQDEPKPTAMPGQLIRQSSFSARTA